MEAEWAVAAGMVGALLVAGAAWGAGVASEAGGVGARVDEYLTRVTPFGFSGTLLVAREGEVLLNKGYGLAIRSEGVPNTAETVFSTGSITKQFTAAAILRLEMMGELSTEDPLSLHLDGVPEDKAGVTLRHLLTHTGGIVGGTGPDYEEVGRDEVVARALAEPIAFPPGEIMSYSNAGYSLLAAVVERVSGRSYEAFLREELFVPSGMERTGYRLPDWSTSTVAHWYRGETDNGTPLEKPYPYWNLLGNGGILSTTGDMYAWSRALRGDEILSAEAKEKLFTPILHDYACGWDVIETERGTVIQHDGGSDLGNSAELRWFVDRDVVIVLFCNQSYGSTPLFELVRDDIETLVFGGDVDLPPAAIASSPERVAGIEGAYRLSTGGDLWVAVDGATATITASGQGGVNALLFAAESEPGQYQDLNLRSNALVAAAVRGDSTVFQGEFPDPARAARVQQFLTDWIRGLEEETGRPAIMANALGTVPGLEDGSVMTQVRLSSDGGDSRLLSFVWRDGRLVGFDQIVFDIVMPVVPVSETAFAAYHLGFGRSVAVAFARKDDGSVVGLTVGPPGRARSAVKRHKHDHDAEAHEHGEPEHDGGDEAGEGGRHEGEHEHGGEHEGEHGGEDE